MALNGLFCADVPLKTYSLRPTQWRSQDLVVLVGELEGRVWGEVFPPRRKRSKNFFWIFGVRMTCFGAFLALF